MNIKQRMNKALSDSGYDVAYEVESASSSEKVVYVKDSDNINIVGGLMTAMGDYGFIFIGVGLTGGIVTAAFYYHKG